METEQTEDTGTKEPTSRISQECVGPSIDVPIVAEKTSKDYYFDAYAHYGVHEEMLKDEVRTSTYQLAMYQNKHLFRGKTVLEVGCGIGLLSLMAAKAGAARVIGIEFSNVAQHAVALVKTNKLENVITIVKGKVEDVDLPHGIDKVDIIISSWMGYCLYFESTVEDVIFARDKWLKPEGIMFPDRCTLRISAIEDSAYRETKLSTWEDVYGIDMSRLIPVALKEPLIDIVVQNMLLTDNYVLLDMDLMKVTKKDLPIDSPFTLTAHKKGVVHGVVVFFEVEFSKCHGPAKVFFSTSPEAPLTHWKQTSFYLNESLAVNCEEVIQGRFGVQPNPWSNRRVDFTLEMNIQRDDETSDHEVNSYRLG